MMIICEHTQCRHVMGVLPHMHLHGEELYQPCDVTQEPAHACMHWDSWGAAPFLGGDIMDPTFSFSLENVNLTYNFSNIRVE